MVKTTRGEEVSRWVLPTVKHDGYQPFWEALVSWRSKRRGTWKQKAADQLLEYVAARSKMRDYPAVGNASCSG
jgi:hypothetical protein